ncbi:MAG: radical SAM protein [Victivallaceae bacterium]|nr:radical SAM protein [Victivallaceae bacterium]
MKNEFCDLCPRHCHALRPESAAATDAMLQGFCRSPRNPVVARAGLHRWEEPVLCGKKGAGAVFFAGCNLHCVYCQNYQISSLNCGREISVERLREIYRELVEAGAQVIDLVTPTHFAEAVLASLDSLPPIPVVWNSNGCDEVSTLRRFEGKVQIYLPDLKYADNQLGRIYSGIDGYFEIAARAIDEMFRQTGPYELSGDGMLRKGVIIRHLILPGQIENTLKIIDYVARRFRRGDILFSLMRQYLPCGKVSPTEYPELNRRVSHREFERVRKALFDSGIEDGFLQTSSSAASEEFIPAFDGTGV